MPTIYLKIQDVDGDVTDAEYVRHIEVLSLSLGGTNPSSVKVGVQAGSGAGGGKVIMEELKFTKVCDRSTPLLTTNFFRGQHFERFEFKYVISRGASSDMFKTVTLTDVLITGFHHAANGIAPPADQQAGKHGEGTARAWRDSALPLEEISVNFVQIEMAYRPRRSTGEFENALKSGYNVARARVV